MRNRPWWFRWVIGVVVLAVLVGIAARAAVAAVQEPYLVQEEAQVGSEWHAALVIVQRNPSAADIEHVIKTFAKGDTRRPLTAEFYTDGNTATSFEGGGPADTPATASAHVGEFKRPPSGPGEGWADSKGAADPTKVTFQAP